MRIADSNPPPVHPRHPHYTPALAAPSVEPAARIRRIERLAPWSWGAAFLLLCANFVLSFMARNTLPLHDGTRYLLLGRSLRQFRYVNLWEQGTPPHLLYPPGYPALLAAVGGLLGNRPAVLVEVSLLASTATLLVSFLVARRVLPAPLAVASLALVALQPTLIGFSGVILSEAPYMLLSTTSVFVASRGRDEDRSLLLGILAVLAALVRSAGVALLLALLLHWILERRWRAALALAVGATSTVGLWLLHVALLQAKAPRLSYASDLQNVPHPGVIGRVAGAVHAAAEYLFLLPSMVLLPTPDHGRLLTILIGAALVGTAVLGTTRLHQGRFVLLYLAVYAGTVVLWPWVLERLIIVVFPVLVPLAVGGVWATLSHLPPRWARPLGGATLAVLLGLAARLALQDQDILRTPHPHSVSEFLAERSASPVERGSFESFRFIQTHLPPGELVLSGRPEPLYYYAGRQQPAGGDDAVHAPSLPVWMQRAGARTVLLTPTTGWERESLAARLQESCDRFALQASFVGNVYLFRLGNPRPGDGAACAAITDFRRAVAQHGISE